MKVAPLFATFRRNISRIDGIHYDRCQFDSNFGTNSISYILFVCHELVFRRPFHFNNKFKPYSVGKNEFYVNFGGPCLGKALRIKMA